MLFALFGEIGLQQIEITDIDALGSLLFFRAHAEVPHARQESIDRANICLDVVWTEKETFVLRFRDLSGNNWIGGCARFGRSVMI